MARLIGMQVSRRLVSDPYALCPCNDTDYIGKPDVRSLGHGLQHLFPLWISRIRALTLPDKQHRRCPSLVGGYQRQWTRCVSGRQHHDWLGQRIDTDNVRGCAYQHARIGRVQRGSLQSGMGRTQPATQARLVLPAGSHLCIQSPLSHEGSTRHASITNAHIAVETEDCSVMNCTRCTSSTLLWEEKISANPGNLGVLSDIPILR